MLDIRINNTERDIANSSLSTKDVAAIFGVNATTIRRWYQQGKILADRDGFQRNLRFRRDAIAASYITREIELFIKVINCRKK